MKAIYIAAITAALTSVVALPAFAAWDRIGTVDVSHRRDRDSQPVNFGGGVEGLQFRATGSDISCRYIRTTFANGRTRDVFSGTLREGRAVNVDLPGNDRSIRRLDFNCRADERRGGRIEITADVGRYRDEWRRNPDWNRLWSRMFNWTNPNPAPVANWSVLSTERFEGRNDREAVYAGWGGRRVDQIALKPLDANARCSRVTARFGNGNTRTLNINGGDRLRQGSVNVIDLPGNDRNLRSLTLNCRADNARSVSIQILAIR